MNFPLNNTLTRGTSTDDPSIKALSDFNKMTAVLSQWKKKVTRGGAGEIC